MSLPNTQQIADAAAALQSAASRADSLLDAIDDLRDGFQQDVTDAINFQNSRFDASSARRIFVDPTNGDDNTTSGDKDNPYESFDGAVSSITAGESIEIVHFGDLTLESSNLLRLVDLVITAAVPSLNAPFFTVQRATLTANNVSANNSGTAGRLSLRGCQLRLDTWDVVLPEPSGSFDPSGQTMFFNRGGLQMVLVDCTLARSPGSNGANAHLTNTANGRLDLFSTNLSSSLDPGQLIDRVNAGADPNDTPGVSSDILVN